MKVDIGNQNAIEPYMDEHDVLRFRRLPGERTTTLIIPDGTPIEEILATVIVTMEAHIEPDTRPAWIEADDLAVQNYLCNHYRIPKNRRRPATWGGELSAEKPKTTKKKTKATAEDAQQLPPVGTIMEDESDADQ